MAKIELARSPYLKKKCISDKGVGVRYALPYARSSRGEYTHRVRYVTMVTVMGKSHLAIGCWCGMSLSLGGRRIARMFDAPEDDHVLCGTCEGRAIGAGLDKTAIINGRKVKYSPKNRMECVT